MSFIQYPAYIITVLLLLIVFSEWLATKKIFRHLGAVLIVIIGAAILANLHVIPSSSNAPALYDIIFSGVSPLGIFFLLLDVKLGDLKKAGPAMLGMFIVGAVATIAGVLVGYWFVLPQQVMPKAFAIAGMFTGTYTGGSANLNAVALQYDMQKDGVLYAAINAVDNILTAVWIVMTLLLPPILQKHFPRKRAITPAAIGLTDDATASPIAGKAPLSISGISVLLALGFGSLFVSNLLQQYFPTVPSMLVLTTLALVFAQLPFVQKLSGAKVLGSLMIMIFLAVIGAYCDIGALLKSGSAAATLMLWDTIIILIHGLLIFLIGALLKQDWAVIGVASNANIGGATTAPACAASLGRSDLELPGILAGSLGLAIGTFLGIMVAEFLK